MFLRPVSYTHLDVYKRQVERGDTLTVEGHLRALKDVGEKQELIYRLLSDRLIEIAHKKHPDRDYEPLEKIIRIV